LTGAGAEEGVVGEKKLIGKGWPLLLVLAGIQFSHILDFAILMPLGPRYQRELQISPGAFGLLVSAYAFMACLSGLLAATFIDRFDRKRVALVLYAGLLGGTLLCGLAGTYELLLVGRCLTGVFGGILGAVVFAIVGDVFPEQRRGLATGLVMSAFSVATIAGIPLGLTLAQSLGTGSPFLVLSGLGVGVLLLAAWLVPPLQHHGHGQQPPVSPWKVLMQPAHLRAYVLMVVLMLGTFTLIPYLPTFLIANVGWKEADLRWMYLCGGAATLVTNSLFGRLADRFGKLKVFRALALSMTIPIVFLTHLGPTPLAAALVLTTLLIVCSSGRMVPAVALITSSAHPAYRGSFLSVNAAVQQLAMGLAALMAGVLLHQAGPNEPLSGYPLIGLLACATTALSVYLAGGIRPAGCSASSQPISPLATAAATPRARPAWSGGARNRLRGSAVDRLAMRSPTPR
jgi:predicted MFS family arabinose efflux permease